MSEETPRPIMLYVEDGKFMGKEIVFCKDCKYWAEFTFNIPPSLDEFKDWKPTPAHYCGRLFQDGNTESIGFYMEADDFCSRGVQK